MNIWPRRVVIGLSIVSLSWVASMGCSDDGDETGGGTGAAGASNTGGGDTGGNNDGGGILSGGSTGQGGAESCADLEATADLGVKPVDIIFLVGNNGSMAQEIEAVEANINANFAAIIDASGVDYRVIMISRSGGHQFNVCVEQPLGGVALGQCINEPNNAEPPPATKFFHYSTIVNGDDSWCVALSSFDGTLPDEYSQAPSGWSQWLRPEAAKMFVMLSDSSLNCGYMGTDLDDGPQSPSMSDIGPAEDQAVAFDTFLLGLSPLHFGTIADRNYIWHSIVGLEAKDPLNATDPWLPADPLSLEKCSAPGGVNSVSPALGYQALSRLSGGLRFPICEFENFDTVFSILAQGVITGAKLDCTFPLPEAPMGQSLDRDSIAIDFTPIGGTTETFEQVAGAGDCAAGKFYLDGETVTLCPETCAEVQTHDEADLDITAGCVVTAN